MPILKVGKKFPWKTLLLAIFVVILGICLGGILLFGVEGFINGIVGLTVAIATFLGGIAWACITNLFFWAGFGIMGAVFFVYFYRKNYAKQKVLVPSTTGSALPASDTLAQPLFNDDTEVATT
jgi:hypothetical protein